MEDERTMDTGKYPEDKNVLHQQDENPLIVASGGKRLSRRTILQAGLGMAVVTAGVGTYLGVERGFVRAATPVVAPSNPVIVWNSAALQAIIAAGIGPTISARALAIVHTAMYDAWTTYDKKAVPTQNNGIARQKDTQGVDAPQAVSFAAYRALIAVFPPQAASFATVLSSLGYDPTNISTNTLTAAGVGNVAAQAVLNYRYQDGANQLGDESSVAIPYSDYTGYTPTLGNPDHWQPLALPTGGTQKFLTAHWEQVKPFALNSANQFRPSGPFAVSQSAFTDQVNMALKLSANLNDTSKVIAEYWSDGPHSVTPPGHWDVLSQSVLAQKIAKARDHTLRDSILLFFMLTNALFDASIAVWECKRFYDSCRPVSAVHMLYSGKQIIAWAGPGKGTQSFDGGLWQSYIKTPPFPEYVSGHSAFSAAGAYVLSHSTGSDAFGDSYTAAPRASMVEPGITPASSVTLTWPTFTSAALEAGMSRRYGGIHFQKADRDGRLLGQQVAAWARSKALMYIQGKQK